MSPSITLRAFKKNHGITQTFLRHLPMLRRKLAGICGTKTGREPCHAAGTGKACFRPAVVMGQMERWQKTRRDLRWAGRLTTPMRRLAGKQIS